MTDAVETDLRLTSKLEVIPDPQSYHDPERALYRAALYVGQHRIRSWMLAPPIPLDSITDLAKLVNDTVAERVKALRTDAAEEHFGPKAAWPLALCAAAEATGAADAAVTTHAEDLAEIKRIERAATSPEQEAPPPAAAPSEPLKRCALYRHFDSAGTLLYVGITAWQSDRDVGHARTSAWVPFADHVTAQWFPSREAAFAAERQAIQSEVPVFNKQHAPAGRQQRVLAYLVGRRRLDLLPKLS